MIPVNEPVIAKKASIYILDCIRTGWVSSAGKYISKFEEKFANYLGVKHAITTTSGTTALHLALVSLGIKKGDEVILPNHTMIACAFAVIYTQATPVLVDVKRDTWNINASKVEEKITKRTKAIMPVHIYGLPVDMNPLVKISKKYNIPLIEDAAEAHGAEYGGKKVGSIGQINCFSFYGNKIITAGEGGMVTTNDNKLAKRARSLKDLAHSPSKRFLHEEIGFNYRITNMQAALGLAQLEEIDSFIEKKHWMAHMYRNLLKNVSGITFPVESVESNFKNVYWMFGILVENEFGTSRDTLRKKLYERGIDTRTFFIPLNEQPALQKSRHIKKNDIYPISKEISEKGMYLPSGLAITKQQIETVCEAIIRIKRSS